MTTTQTSKTLTDLQARVLLAFPGGAGAEGDNGASWTDVADLAKETGLTKKQVQGVLASLSKNGLIYADEEGGAGNILQCLTDDGARVVGRLQAEAAAEGAAEAAEAAPVNPKPTRKERIAKAAQELAEAAATPAKPKGKAARTVAPSEVLDGMAGYRFFYAGSENHRNKPTGGGYAFIAWLIGRGEAGCTVAEMAEAGFAAVHLRWDLQRNADKFRWEIIPAEQPEAGGDLTAEVLNHCADHYENGWCDLIIETVERADLTAAIAGAKTLKGALRKAKALVSGYADQRAEIKALAD